MVSPIPPAEAGSSIAVTGEMDAHSAYDVYLTAMAQAADGMGPVVLDLKDVTFIDSVGLSMLIRIREDLKREHDTRLVLRRVSTQVARLLELTALTAEFEIA